MAAFSFCPKCGNEIQSDFNICPKCSCQLKVEFDQNSPEYQTENTSSIVKSQHVYNAAQSTHRLKQNNLGAISLVFAILGLTCCNLFFISSILAIIFSIKGIAQASRNSCESNTLAVAGLIMGVLGLILGISLTILGILAYTSGNLPSFNVELPIVFSTQITC